MEPTLGDRIRAARALRKMSQGALADDLREHGCASSVPQISRWESGSAVPDARQIARLVELFGWDAGEALRWVV